MYIILIFVHLTNGDYMKKILIIILFFIILTGCELNNNPTSKVEELLGNYQGLNKSINYNYIELSKEAGLNQELIDKYESLLKKQYRNMVYEIKEEKIDGNKATVTTEIEVIDYKSIIDKYTNKDEKTSETHEQIINELNNETDKITYTIDFSLIKNKEGNWKLEKLTTEEEKKLLGIY